MAKGKPKRDGSGGGTRANIGRGGCDPYESVGINVEGKRGKRNRR